MDFFKDFFKPYKIFHDPKNFKSSLKVLKDPLSDKIMPNCVRFLRRILFRGRQFLKTSFLIKRASPRNFQKLDLSYLNYPSRMGECVYYRIFRLTISLETFYNSHLLFPLVYFHKLNETFDLIQTSKTRAKRTSV